MPPRTPQTRPGDAPPDAPQTPDQDAPTGDTTPTPATAEPQTLVSPTPETPAVPEPPVEPQAPEGLAPAWDPDDVVIAGRPSALQASEEIAIDLGHDQRVEAPTDQTEEA